MKVIISGGGTGGHIFPAIAIANAIKKIDTSAEILFVGALGKMEMKRVPEAGYPIEGLWISGFQRNLTIKNFLFPAKVLVSLLKAGQIIKKFKPDVVIGVGGFASGPTLRAAIAAGVPTAIQEQNSFPGITNKLLAKKVNRIFTAYSQMEKFFPKDKIILSGNPVREQAVNIEGKKEAGLANFGLQNGKTTLLVVGGSQGAWSINEAIEKAIPQLITHDIQIIWQTGSPFKMRASQAILKSGSSMVQSVEFINQMELAYAAADIIVSRSGAIAISELCIVGKPVILVPYPAAAEDHQTKNAAELANRHAAILLSDRLVRTDLAQEILRLASDFSQQHTLSSNIKKMAIDDADKRIAREIISMVHSKKQA